VQGGSGAWAHRGTREPAARTEAAATGLERTQAERQAARGWWGGAREPRQAERRPQLALERAAARSSGGSGAARGRGARGRLARRAAAWASGAGWMRELAAARVAAGAGRWGEQRRAGAERRSGSWGAAQRKQCSGSEVARAGVMAGDAGARVEQHAASKHWNARALGIQAAQERGAGDIGAGAGAERTQARVWAQRGPACRTERASGALARRFGVG
jgi:hypothetical protein